MGGVSRCFCYSLSLTERLDSLPTDILDFEQLEKESIGAAWARFSRLLASIPDMSIPDEVSMEVFYSGLDMETTLELDDASRGWFAHTTPEEGRDILDSFFEDSFFATDHSEPRREESVSSHESLSTPESEPSSSTSQYSFVEPSPEPRTPKEEEIQLRSSLPDSRMILQEISKTPRILGMRNLRNRCVLMRHSIKFSAIHPQWVGQRRQSVLPKQFGLAQPLQPSLVL